MHDYVMGNLLIAAYGRDYRRKKAASYWVITILVVAVMLAIFIVLAFVLGVEEHSVLGSWVGDIQTITVRNSYWWGLLIAGILVAISTLTFFSLNWYAGWVSYIEVFERGIRGKDMQLLSLARFQVGYERVASVEMIPIDVLAINIQNVGKAYHMPVEAERAMHISNVINYQIQLTRPMAYSNQLYRPHDPYRY